MNIKEIALRLAHRKCTSYDHVPVDMGIRYSFGEVDQMRITEALVAELAKENKPVAWYDGNKFYANEESASMACADMANLKPVFTTPPNTADIEQRVAEAFLKALNGKLAHTFGHDCADALKANWREYL